MKFTINWLFCPYRSNQHRSWTVLHSHLSYWWTVILTNWKNGKKHAQHNKKQGPHSLFLQTGILTSSSCVSIIIFNLTSQIDIEWCRLCCFMGYSEIASWYGFPPSNRPQVISVPSQIGLKMKVKSAPKNKNKKRINKKKLCNIN
jgi:hypothetical protein